MIQNRVAPAILEHMEGKLAEHPLAELIREIVASRLFGALRLSRERARVAIYFEEGKLVFATSNLRAHRLREVARRYGLAATQFEDLPARASDDDFAAALIQSGQLKPEALTMLRGHQVSDVLRVALLWIEGKWEFDRRVRIAEDLRGEIDVNRLLMECARHLPTGFVATRLESTNGVFVKARRDNNVALPAAETALLSRAAKSATLGELATVSGQPKEASYPAIYALSLSGLLERSEWPTAIGAGAIRLPPKADGHRSPPAPTEVVEVDEAADVEALFARLELAKDHYETLDVARLATSGEIKDSYHKLARRFHPDRFHQSEPQLRTQVESAFARIAQAYEVLSNQSLRADYDLKWSAKPGPSSQNPATAEREASGTKQSAPESDAKRATQSFQRGRDASQNNRHEEAIRFLAEAAMLSPREARFRAYYGQALARQSKTRRMAETELQAALALEPENASYRIMLAELYRQLGLQKRAEGELERALALDPKNNAARSLLVSLRSKSQK
jgi:curved DNA-binding protein CbpA